MCLITGTIFGYYRNNNVFQHEEINQVSHSSPIFKLFLKPYLFFYNKFKKKTRFNSTNCNSYIECCITSIHCSHNMTKTSFIGGGN